MKSVFGGPVRGHVQVELLSAYLDQQASPAEQAYVDAHLQQCTQCRAELDSLRRTVMLLQALPRVAVPRAFTLSEAQVGIRRPAASPGWFGGLVRGLGAVAAILVVAFVAFSVLRPEQAPWNPPQQTMARVAPTPAPVAKVMATQPTLAQAPAAPAPQVEAPAATAAQAESRAATASEPTPAPEPPQVALMAAPSPEPTQQQAADTAAPAATEAPAATDTSTAPLLAKAAPSTPAGAAGAGGASAGAATAGAAAASAAVSAAPSAAAPEISAAAATGRGGGGPSEPVGIPPQFLTPEPTPAARPLAEALPPGVRLAYSDLNALWAIDRDGGLRKLVQGQGISSPQLSPNEQWIAYRTYTDKGLQVWAVRWDGGQPKLLLDDATLPKDGLPAGYARRAISDTRWGPKNNILTVTMSLVPDPSNPKPPKTELWQVDVESGDLKYLSELGRAWRPYYSPDGKEYLVLQYGTEDKPEGSLSLVDSKSGKGKVVMTFPASVGKNGYDSQVAWMPDGKSAWVAIPTPDYGTPVPPNGTKLYRVTANGEAKEAGDIDASEVYWSPAGNAMAYTRWADETMATKELYLAKPDGTQAQLYASTNQGEFISWSPKGSEFIYQDNFQIFAGAPGRQPARLANATSIVNPRWVSESQIMATHDTGTGWLLTLTDADGKSVGLVPLPREAMWDAGSN